MEAYVIIEVHRVMPQTVNETNLRVTTVSLQTLFFSALAASLRSPSAVIYQTLHKHVTIPEYFPELVSRKYGCRT